METFTRLHKKVQEAIWYLGWKNFRPIQDQSIDKVLSTVGDIIIAAPTASGKTEAAFIPIISLTAETLLNSVEIVYISPLKALINDQFMRVSDLCKKMDITITKWHGDASFAKKKSLLQKSNGILLITPESIEALLIRKEPEARRIFSKTKFFVIDELHVFVGQERGVQLRSLLSRIDRLVGRRPRRICLSATIGDMDIAIKWLKTEKDCSVETIVESDVEKETQGIIHSFIVMDENDNKFDNHLFENTKLGLNLIFGNSKKQLEETCDLMKRAAQKHSFPDNFRIHHGSLAKEIREDTEQELKRSENLSVFCTNTLELGIDIGNIDKVFLLDPPWSVSSFIQRIGRSGRKENRPIRFEFVLRMGNLTGDSSSLDKIRYDLVKSIALTELMLDGWCEPPVSGFNDFSVYVHQVLSYIIQRGGAPAVDVFDQINNRGFADLLSGDEFAQLLRHLGEKGFIEQAQNGDLIVGSKGEPFVESFEFYSVFQTPQQWKVVCRGQEIGEIPMLAFYSVGDHLMLGGQRWKVIDIKEESKLILVERSKGGRAALFYGSPGVISKELHRKMLEIYRTQKIPSYLSGQSIEALELAFDQFEVLTGKKSNFLPVFMGTKVQNTLALFLKFLGVEVDSYEVGFDIKSANADNVRQELIKRKSELKSALQIVKSIPRADKIKKKYDFLLPDSLLDRAYINNYTDFFETELWLQDLK